jgi:hypothetical protein
MAPAYRLATRTSGDFRYTEQTHPRGRLTSQPTTIDKDRLAGDISPGIAAKHQHRTY